MPPRRRSTRRSTTENSSGNSTAQKIETGLNIAKQIASAFTGESTGTTTLESVAETPRQTEQSTAKATVSKGRSDDSEEKVYVSCALSNGIKFDDVDNGHGGVETVVIPGHNHGLRGQQGAILDATGHASLFPITRRQWESIKKKHGRERPFTSNPPLLREWGSVADFNSKTAQDEIRASRTGVEPRRPEDLGVEKAKAE